VNILVDSCSYNCQNAGDLAMLTVAVSRLRELWPSAAIAVVTNAPALVARHCGVVGTVPVRGRRLLLEERLLGPVSRRLPGAVASRCASFERELLLRRPRVVAASVKLKAVFTGRDVRDVDAFLDAIDAADLVVVNGAGIITDAFRDQALGILTTLELAQRRGTPTALVGQGLGPIHDLELRERAARTLRGARLVAVRESLSGPPLLASLGVDPGKVVVTGDDAIELAYRADAEDEGRVVCAAPWRIGVNLRIAPYADIAPELLPTLRELLRRAAHTYDARLVPIPIAHHGGGMDVDTLRTLLEGIGDGDGGAALQTPSQVIARIGGCRVVVTGSYHGAVFALSQGIPAVAIVKSRYYLAKMAGVAHEFGAGCHIVSLDDGDMAAALTGAISRAWEEADTVREPLLRAAADQIRRGRSAYARLALCEGLRPPAAVRLPLQPSSSTMSD
jgi:colanic acid/amylovoran biosynthesis protein